LETAELHRRLAPRAPRREGPGCYAKFVSAGKGVKLWDEALSGQIYLGGETFVKRMQARAESLEKQDIPRAQRRTPGKPLSWYLKQHDRDAAIARAYLEGGHTQTAIAKAMNLSISRVSRLIAVQEEDRKRG
jgi:hypothetical protein